MYDRVWQDWQDEDIPCPTTQYGMDKAASDSFDFV